MIMDDIGGLLGPINVHEMSVTKLRILIWISGNKRKDSFQKENVHLKKGWSILMKK